MTSIPTGTVTFLFTDMEVSTPLWEKFPDAMGKVIARHDELVRAVIGRRGGYVFKTVGDEICASFAVPQDAIAAALEAQQAIQAEDWGEVGPVKVRMGIHSGTAEERAGDYFGVTLSRVARIRGLGHGGQVLVSLAARELCGSTLPAGASFRGLGMHRLRGLEEPEQVFQLVHPDLPAEFPPLAAAVEPPTNLPTELSSFVGREREMDEVCGLLSRHRLVTLTGPGGSGKTRLALEVGARLAEQYPDGVWLVELAPLSTSASVAQAAVSALGLREEPGGSLSGTLVEYLRGRQLLLLLDNCEHLVEAAAELAHAVLSACPNVRILATGRESLGITGEHRWPVPSLSLPASGELPPLAELCEFEAVRLFVERAAEVEPGFDLTAENAPAVARICNALDGIPLAIELAARRLRALSPEQIASRMTSQVQLLTGGSKASLPRQQTLRAAIDWSYEPLGEQEQRLFRSLAVFAGGWTLEAASAVCGAGSEDALLDGLALLVDRSLVLKEQRDGEARYRFLEMMRQYARARLTEAGEEAAARGRHRRWCLDLAVEAERHLRTRDMQHWLRRLESERDNLREALAVAAPGGEEANEALLLASTLVRFWSLAGYWTEGTRLLEDALAAAPEAKPALQAKAQYGLGALAFSQGDYARARELLEASQALLPPEDSLGTADALNLLGIVAQRQGDYPRAVGLLEETIARYRSARDQQRLSAGLNNLGLVVEAQGNYPRAASLYEESLSIKRELGDELGAAGSLHNLGVIALYQGDVGRARTLQEETLAIGRRLGNRRAIATALTELGKVALRTGDADRAASLYRETLDLLGSSGDKLAIVECLEGLGYAAQATEAHAKAVTLLAAAECLREAIGAPLPPAQRVECERALDVARVSLGEEEHGRARAAGRAMSLEAAAEFGLRE